ncbi:MAG TPA: DUF1810 domain-containing protein [Sphingomonas sp.]|jgi:uncharacterized protein (DUF1810 family)|nr:DUF1810 domain-containing protein [Sphingomonas sp.]
MDFDRFVAAQDPVFASVLDELRKGAKRGHWMWFVFPQIAGLGHSDMARAFAIPSLADARAYLAHPVLGTRLRQAVEATLSASGRAQAIFGAVDAMKLRSSMTLFERAAADEEKGPTLFARALDRFYEGSADPETLARL